MPFILAEVSSVVEQLWPVSGAEAWDAPGLICGDPAAQVSHILLTVDTVAETADEAQQLGAELVIAHHPLLLRGVTSVAEDRYKGAVLSSLIRSGRALIAAHTNADVVETGTSAALARALGLLDVAPITAGDRPGRGLGRAGRLAKPTTLGRLAGTLAELLPPTASGVRVAGGYNQPVQTVSLCGGAGDSLLSEPAVLASDVYITSDLRHHPASESRENARLRGGPALIDVSHWASEWLWLETAAAELRQKLPGMSVSVSETRTDPWDFSIVQ